MPAYLRTLLWLAILIVPGGLLLLPLVVMDAGQIMRSPGRKAGFLLGTRLRTASPDRNS